MRFQADPSSKVSINNYTPGLVQIGRQNFNSSIIIFPNGEIQPWSCASYSDLTKQHIADWSTLDAQIVLIGCGVAHQSIQPGWLPALHEKKIGVESMSSMSACRTFNFLIGEGRKVVLALIV
jgi:uncharacterized protein